jgi:serine/threonine-protein kinase HipA
VRKARTTTGGPFLIIERYDRDLTTDPIRRLHQEDFCQALALPPDRKYQSEGGPSIAQSAQLLRDCTPVPAQELPRFLRAVTFNWIVGNCDAHGKNYSLLYDRGAPTLAPLYDIVSTVLYPELTTRLAMSIDGARQLDRVDEASWLSLAADARYRPAFVRRTVGELLSVAAPAARALAATPDHDNESARRISDRIQRLTDLEIGVE